jgi:hypothetical protein
MLSKPFDQAARDLALTPAFFLFLPNATPEGARQKTHKNTARGLSFAEPALEIRLNQFDAVLFDC